MSTPISVPPMDPQITFYQLQLLTSVLEQHLATSQELWRLHTFTSWAVLLLFGIVAVACVGILWELRRNRKDA